MSLVVTLISSPDQPALNTKIAEEISNSSGATGLRWLDEPLACEFHLANGTRASDAEAGIRNLLAGWPIDVVVQELENRRKNILIADMDSTIIRQECIDELAAEAGLGDRIAQITARAMNGEIAFEEALIERVHMLAGLPASIIDRVLDTRITLASGGRSLVRTMRQNGGYTALVSGGFTSFTSRISALAGFDEHRANILLEHEGQLTGTVAEPILGQSAKVEALESIANRLGRQPSDAIAVGDGANDLSMLACAGTGVALHAKPAVAAAAPIRIEHGDLTALLYLQGYHRSEIIS